jgi:hypothetical protein
MTSLMDVDTTDKVRRDQWGRYLIVPPNGGKPVGYTRATTVAKALDDTSNLMLWGQRMTATGLAKRPDLLALVSTTTDKKRLNDICERAKEAGGATERRDLGTALHAMIESSFTVDGYAAPDAYAADVAAVVSTLRDAGLRPVATMHERTCVMDAHRIAGTFDLVLEAEGQDGRLFIADIKTGAASSLSYAALGFAVQLAIYANADALYVQGPMPADDVRTPMLDVDKGLAYIVHVEPGSGVCDLHLLDIAAGWEALETAMAVRQWRNRKGLLVAVPPKSRSLVADVEIPPLVAKRAWLESRIDQLRTMGRLDALQTAWQIHAADIPTLKKSIAHTLDDLAKIERAVDAAEAKAQAPFETTPDPSLPEPQPLRTPTAAPTTGRERPYVDEGEPFVADDMENMRGCLRALPDDQRALASLWARQANEYGTGFNLGRHTSRRWHLARVVLAAVEVGEDIAVAVAQHALPFSVHGTSPFGATLGICDVEDAAALAHAFDNLGGSLVLTFSDDGTPVVGPVAAVA